MKMKRGLLLPKWHQCFKFCTNFWHLYFLQRVPRDIGQKTWSIDWEMQNKMPSLFLPHYLNALPQYLKNWGPSWYPWYIPCIHSQHLSAEALLGLSCGCFVHSELWFLCCLLQLNKRLPVHVISLLKKNLEAVIKLRAVKDNSFGLRVLRWIFV